MEIEPYLWLPSPLPRLRHQRTIFVKLLRRQGPVGCRPCAVLSRDGWQEGEEVILVCKHVLGGSAAG